MRVRCVPLVLHTVLLDRYEYSKLAKLPVNHSSLLQALEQHQQHQQHQQQYKEGTQYKEDKPAVRRFML